MKNLFILSCVLCLFSASAQGQRSIFPIDSTTNQISYQGTIQTPGFTQSELYAKAKAWYPRAFFSSKHVLRRRNSRKGKLLGKCSVATGDNRYQRAAFTLSVDTYEGGYSYQLTNVTLEMPPGKALMGGREVRTPASSVPILKSTILPEGVEEEGIDWIFQRMIRSLHEAMTWPVPVR
jgi:hypothetical protein